MIEKLKLSDRHDAIERLHQQQMTREFRQARIDHLHAQAERKVAAKPKVTEGFNPWPIVGGLICALCAFVSVTIVWMVICKLNGQ